MNANAFFGTKGALRALRAIVFCASFIGMVFDDATASVFFEAPVSGELFLQEMGGSAGGTTIFGLGTSTGNFVQYLAGLPNAPSSVAPVDVGFFNAGTSINFGMLTTFAGQTAWAFSSGVDPASIEAFTDTHNSLGLGGSAVQSTGPYTWLLHLDDALSADGDNNDVLIQLSFVPVAAVPELSTWAMMLLGFAGIGFLMHRRSKAVRAV
jgi:hypothetical protein